MQTLVVASKDWGLSKEAISAEYNLPEHQVREALALSRRYPKHGEIILAAQRSFTLHEPIVCLDHLLVETQAEDWPGQVRWLADWRG